MAEKMLKGTLLISLMLVLAIGAPVMTRAQLGGSGDFDIGALFSDAGKFEDMLSFLPGFFGGMGGAGQVLGQIFSLLLPQFMNLSAAEMIPGFYVINATSEKTYNSSTTITGGVQQKYYYADYAYYEDQKTVIDAAFPGRQVGYPYCIVTREGTGAINTSRTVGVSVMIGIWDADKTLVNTINRVIQTVKSVFNVMGDSASTESEKSGAIEEAVNSILYLLIHINDIITGDELVMFNPITYEHMQTNGTFGESYAWKVDNWDGTGGDHQVSNVPGPVITAWNNKANEDNNGFMEWLTTGINLPTQYRTNTWGRFSFDLVQLWLKRFYVSIDVSKIVELFQGGGSTGVNPAEILKDLDIEFYILWHHLMGGVLYNDTIPGAGYNNGKIDVTYKNVTYPNGTVVTTADGTVVQRPDSSEVTHLIGLKALGGGLVQWNMPKPNSDKTKVSWGVRFNSLNVFWTPVGMDPEDASAVGGNSATLTFLELGFTFIPGEVMELNNVDGTPSGKEGRNAKVKLDQHIGQWSALPPAGLDFSMVYVSTLVHVHFTASMIAQAVQHIADPEKASEAWDEGNKQGYVDSSSVSVNGELKFGSEAGSKDLMVGKVDIAGPNYNIYEYGHANDPAYVHSAAASTQIVPVGLFTLDAQAGMSYTDSYMNGGGFQAAAFLGIEFSVMLYSVNYPLFSDYQGGLIWHDPTFSIFMTFEAGTYWAIILLIGVVALVGIAAILITRSKNSR